MEDRFLQFLYDPTVGRLVTIVIGISLIWVAVKAIQRNLLSRMKDSDNRYRAKKLSTLLGYFSSLVMLIVVFSDRLSGLTVALGVAGAGIAFALQEVIASVAGWLAVMFGGFYKTGDRVQLGGIKGDVIDIGVSRTTIMETGQWVDGDLYNGRIVRIANSFVFKEPVFNYSGDFPFLWDEIKIPVMFGSDYALAKAIVETAAREIVGDYSEQAHETWKQMVKKYLIEDASTDPMVTLVVNDNWVELTLRYVTDFKKRRSTKDKLFFRILQDVEATGNRVRFASATFHLVETPEIKVRIQ